MKIKLIDSESKTPYKEFETEVSRKRFFITYDKKTNELWLKFVDGSMNSFAYFPPEDFKWET